MAGSSCTPGWDEEFFKQIGLEDLTCNNFAKIGSAVSDVGEPCGGGLNEKASVDLHLPVGTSVASGIIDAHAGGLGCLGCSYGPAGSGDIPP